jgi:lysophospholipase L1-like esterase
MSSIVIFGDSITQGFWDTRGGWVQRIRSKFDEEFLLEDVFDGSVPYLDFYNLGIDGDTSNGVLSRLEDDLKPRLGDDGDVVVFAVGSNDAIVENGKPWTAEDQFKENLAKLLGVAQKHVSKIMFVGLTPCDETLTTPVPGQDAYCTNERLRLFDQIMRDFCSENAVKFVNVFDKFLNAMGEEKLLADGSHPNNAGSQLVADIVEPRLREMVSGAEEKL